MRDRIGVHLELRVGPLSAKGGADTDVDAMAPAAIGMAMLLDSVAACVPVLCLVLVGLVAGVPGSLLGILAAVTFLVVFAVAVSVTAWGGRGRAPAPRPGNGHAPNGVAVRRAPRRGSAAGRGARRRRRSR